MNDGRNITKNQYILVSLILFFALILRLYLSQFGGYELDINHFTTWSREVYNNGFSNFYQNTGSDYPPFYIYILWIVGAINNFISGDIFSLIILKVPAIIADLATALLIFLIVRKYTTFETSLLSMILYVFNPAIIYNSTIWGQVDSVYTFFLIFAVYEFISKRPTSSAILFGISILTKPQSLVLLPLFIILIIQKYSFRTLVKSTCVSGIIFLLLAKPFYFYTSVCELYKLYISSYIQYPFTTLNAFNFWALGGMFRPDDVVFLFLTYRMWGYLLFGMLFIFVVYNIIKKNDERLIYLSSALLFFGFFMLFTRIHERYMFPMFAFLIIATIFDKRLYIIYILSSITFFANLYLVFEGVKTGDSIPMSMFIILYIIGINIILFIYLCYCISTYRESE